MSLTLGTHLEPCDEIDAAGGGARGEFYRAPRGPSDAHHNEASMHLPG